MLVMLSLLFLFFALLEAFSLLSNPGKLLSLFEWQVCLARLLLLHGDLSYITDA